MVSIEIDPAVRRLRALNPWSQPFLHDEGIEKLEGDSEQFISGFEAGSFDAVLHDPPRFSLAGRLYGADFCRELCRMLRPGGRLMFYTGEPYRSGRGRDFVGGVGRRLSEAGFKARWRRPLQAFVCRK